nr:rhodopsin orphan GPCR [Hymenolepis microstoma]
MNRNDPNALVYYSDTCDPAILNRTKEYEQVQNSKAHITLMVLAAFAVVLEATALGVLTRPGATRFGSMRQSLVTLTAIEMWLTSTILVNKLWDLYVIEKHEKLPELCFSFILFLSVNSATCSRNWVVTFIALARCEVITRPVASRISTHIFSPRRQLIYIGIFILVGVILSTIRIGIRPMVICTNLESIVHFPNVSRYSRTSEIIENTFFAYQSAIPITVVTIATLFMIIALLRHRMPFEKKTQQRRKLKCTSDEKQWWNCCRIQRKGQVNDSSGRDENGCGSVVKSIQTVRHAQRLPNQIRATRFIIFIATVFIVCEAPVFFAVVFKSAISELFGKFLNIYLRLLIIIDSFSNFFIYLLTSRPFRVELVNLLCCRKTQYRSSSTISQHGL